MTRPMREKMTKIETIAELKKAIERWGDFPTKVNYITKSAARTIVDEFEASVKEQIRFDEMVEEEFRKREKEGTAAAELRRLLGEE